MRCPEFITGGQKWTGWHISTFLITFFSYAQFHCVRKSFSNVKNSMVEVWLPANLSYSNPHFTQTKNWIPDARLPLFFDEADAESFLGTLDAVFMISYAIGLYISGVIGDRLDARLVLSSGMILSGLTCIMFGTVSELFGIYHKAWYVFWWTLGGFVQSSGWPAEVSVMGNWFSRNNRGLVLGLWASCASIGNIIGAQIASKTVEYGYEYVFLISGVWMIGGAVIVFFSLVSKPEQIGLEPPNEAPASRSRIGSMQEGSTQQPHNRRRESEAISIFSALMLPGVISYSLAYACLKLVNYSFFFWLPFYLANRFHWSESTADYLSTWYDWGGIVGGLLAGVITDHLASRSPVIIVMLLTASGSLFWYKDMRNSVSQLENGFVMAVCGLFIGGPSNLISSAVSADLGSQPQMAGNLEALATVTGIVDGTGSVGAALGQILVPTLHAEFCSWNAVFYLFIVMTIITALLLMPLAWREYKTFGCYRSLPTMATLEDDERNLIASDNSTESDDDNIHE